MKYKYSILLSLILLILVGFILMIPKCNIQEANLSMISYGTSQTIAILDSGLDRILIDEYADNIVKTYNVVDDNEEITDNIGHGTALTTYLLGSKMMQLDGLLPNVKVILIKVTDKNGHCSMENLLKGLTVAEKYGATVINISLGGDIEDKLLTKKINDLYSKNITVVASSGDYSEKDLLYPALLDTVVSVASVNNKYEISDFSNYNEDTLTAFPGESMSLVSLNNGALEKTNNLYGTSYATIYASAYIAAIKDYAIAHRKDLTNKELFVILRQTNPLKTKQIVLDLKGLL